jgi:hypothetical protein
MSLNIITESFFNIIACECKFLNPMNSRTSIMWEWVERCWRNEIFESESFFGLVRWWFQLRRPWRWMPRSFMMNWKIFFLTHKKITEISVVVVDGCFRVENKSGIFPAQLINHERSQSKDYTQQQMSYSHHI